MDRKELERLRCSVAENSEILQFDLRTIQNFTQFAKERGVDIFNKDTVRNLFWSGLLRADLVKSAGALDVEGFCKIHEEDGVYFYADFRRVPHRSEGYASIFQDLPVFPENMEVYFHPFRLYPLYHIDRVFRANIDSTQYLVDRDGLVRLAQRINEMLDHGTSRESFASRLQEWNELAELAIVLEPAAYARVFHSIRWRGRDTEESIREKLTAHRTETQPLLQSLKADELRRKREDLGMNAESLDRNKMVHVLLRLMSQHERLKLRGSLGGCMLFLSMAEIIRRAAEEARDEKLPEEDEIGFGQWMEGARQSIYGTERIFDADTTTCREFLTSMGLDYGIKTRCYVEGETEYGALTSAVGEAAGTEFVNLRGQVAARQGKGLLFRDSLKSDKANYVFSVAVIDADREEFVRPLKKAAEDEVFFGRFFLSDPDFALGNFTREELVTIALGLTGREREALPSRAEIDAAISAADSESTFIRGLKKVGIDDVDKGADWGTALMDYALSHPEFPEGHSQAGRERPCIEMAKLLLRARHSGFRRSVERYKVDPETGELVERGQK